VDRRALALYKEDPGLARDFLTKRAADTTAEVVARWQKLGQFLIWKYLDGNVRDEQGKVTFPRYPDAWYRRIVKDHGPVIEMKKVEGLAADEE
jgi:hypothetical protein